MVKWLGLILPALLTAVAGLSDVIQPWIAAHPTLVVILASLGSAIAALSKSPVGKK